MKSSKSKRKLTTEDVCREYFESQIFHLKGIDEASPAHFFVDASIFLEVTDASSKGIDFDAFLNFDAFLKEMTAVNIELFGLVWLNHNYELSEELVPESFPTGEIVFTKRYLQDTGRSDIWERMSCYNDEILKTIAEQTVALESWGDLRDISVVTREEDQVEIATKQLTERMHFCINLVSKYTKDSECTERLAIRLLYVPCDISRIVALSQKLSLTLMGRLGCDLSQAGLFALQRVIVGVYGNAVKYLDAVREWGSYEAAKDATRALVEDLKRVVRKQQQK